MSPDTIVPVNNTLIICISKLPVCELFRSISSRIFNRNYITGNRLSRTICIGNIYIGGTGKTPLSIKVCQLLNKKNIRSTVLKKFYNEHKDEQLLISNKTNLISKINRKKCIENAIEKNYEFAIFDDGLQDKSIKYDLKICCFNSSYWIGNGCIMPAGPLREKIHAIKNFDIVFLNGPNKENENIKTKIFEINSNIKIFEGRYKVKNSEKLD